MMHLMKFKNNRYRFFKFGWRIFLIAMVLIIITYAAIQSVIKFTSPRHYSSTPAKTITVNHPLETELYFNNSVGEAGALDIIKKQIDEAQYSIEIAVYSFNSVDLKNALYAADKRGVRITLVLDKSLFGQHDLFLVDMPSDIKRIDAGAFDPNNSLNTYYMHDKFIITDFGYPSEKITTGSLNFTDLGEKFNQSFLLSTTDNNIISLYENEFDLLAHGLSGIKKLSTADYNPWAATINYSDSFLQVWFSPGLGGQSLKQRILGSIKSAKQTIDIMMWELTDEDITHALEQKADAGVNIRIVAEQKTAFSTSSTVSNLINFEKKNPTHLEVILDTKLAQQTTAPLPDNFTPYIHHHMMIVDGSTLIFGSSNWSTWGFYHNDENALITNSPSLIAQFQDSFDHFYTLLK